MAGIEPLTADNVARASEVQDADGRRWRRWGPSIKQDRFGSDGTWLDDAQMSQRAASKGTQVTAWRTA